MSTPGDAAATIRSKRYLALLVLAAAIGVPISALAYFFLYLVSRLQHWLFTSLPHGLGFHGEPVWWPVPLLAVAGVLVAATIKYLPGAGGHSPADGLPRGRRAQPVGTAGSDPGRAGHAGAGRGAGAGGATDRHRAADWPSAWSG